MARTEYAPDIKAAVLAALLAGQSVGEIAREYTVPEATVRSWKSRQGSGSVANVATQKKDAVGDLLVGYLETNLQTLRVQSEVFSDRVWLQKQDASALAVLHGVLADKTVRLLEALGGSGDA